MSITLALAGNPNCGKTTMFNELTGSNQYVGNWPGVTVEKKEGRYRGDKNVIVTDLPGIYSLSPYTLEEVVTRDYLVNEKPDVILNIVDASNIERNLYLTTQLMEMGIPVVIALNMMDIVRKHGDVIDIKKLSDKIGCPVIETAAVKSEGLDEAVKIAVQSINASHNQLKFSDKVEDALTQIEQIACHFIKDEAHMRWYAVKLFERDQKVLEKLNLSDIEKQQIETIIRPIEQLEDDGSDAIIINERYTYITEIVKQSVKKNRKGLTTSDKIDRILTNRILALPIFAIVMFAVYYIAVTTIGDMVTGFMNDTLIGEWIQAPLAEWMTNIGTADWLNGLVVDGIIGGVGAVVGFVPQMLVLFFMLSILEDCGYMSRVAFIMDRIFCKFGLSGKSFIPMLIGSGCSVPGIMASRTIEQDRDRKMTIITTSFIPCGAKMPIIALIAGALFGGAWWIAPSAYFVGILAVVVSGLILKKTKMFAGDVAPFVMELPQYHMPIPSNVLRTTMERGISFIKKAGTVILVASIFVWFTSSFGFIDGSFGMVEDMDHSVLAAIGSAIAPIFAPLGFGNWQSAVATVLGLVAKEEVVGVFGTLFSVSGDALALVEEGSFGALGNIAMHFTAISGYSFLIFNLLCAPCFAAMGAIKREMNNTKWTWFALGYQTIFAYTVALMINQFGLLATGAGFTMGTAVAVVVLLVYIYLIFRKPSVQKELYKKSAKAQRA